MTPAAQLLRKRFRRGTRLCWPLAAVLKKSASRGPGFLGGTRILDCGHAIKSSCLMLPAG